jgi:hypothetical protein
MRVVTGFLFYFMLLLIVAAFDPWSVCAWIHLPIFFHLSFLNFCACNVEFTKDIIVLESSSDPNGCTAGNDQNHDLSKIAVDAKMF